jgi:pyruvate-formate lyase
MADKLTTSSQHITALDFDLTKAFADLNNLEARFNQSMRNIEAKSTMNINKRTASRGAIGQVTDEMREMSLMESQFRRRMGWFFSGTLFYGTIAGARQAVQAMRDVETAVMKVGRVMEDATFIDRAYREELIDLASEYGQDFDVAADIALQFAQAGYNVKDSLDLTKTSLLAVNSAELNVQNATSSMIGIMAQWNLTASEMPLVLDKINKTGWAA